MKSIAASILIAAFSSTLAIAAEPLECQSQTVENSVVEMCLQRGTSFQHDLYILKSDGIPIFSLVDDYVENVKLEHIIPPGLTIEFPLSKQGGNSVKIEGGCTPESKDGMEVARLCNFHWGKLHVVRDVRFEFR